MGWVSATIPQHQAPTQSPTPQRRGRGPRAESGCTSRAGPALALTAAVVRSEASGSFVNPLLHANLAGMKPALRGNISPPQLTKKEKHRASGKYPTRFHNSKTPRSCAAAVERSVPSRFSNSPPPDSRLWRFLHPTPPPPPATPARPYQRTHPASHDVVTRPCDMTPPPAPSIPPPPPAPAPRLRPRSPPRLLAGGSACGLDRTRREEWARSSANLATPRRRPRDGFSVRFARCAATPLMPMKSSDVTSIQEPHTYNAITSMNTYV